MPSTKKLLQAAAGSAGGDKLYVEDVFSAYVFTGTGANMIITNGIDLLEGGLVWAKNRNVTNAHYLFDTSSNGALLLQSNVDSAAIAVSPPYMVAQSTGYKTAGADSGWNGVDQSMVSWTFRKAEKFFDIQTWTGNDVQGREISHALGSTPGCIICKDLDTSTNWIVYNSGTGATKATYLNTNSTAVTASLFWDNTAPTDSVFTIGDFSSINASGRNYVAYIFASDAGGFGDDGDESIIKCGSYVDSGSEITVNLGWEPQYILLRNTTAADQNWWIFDTMRGWPGVFGISSGIKVLYSNLNNSEAGMTSIFNTTATGFVVKGNEFASGTYTYMAIRRPMKTPEAGTEVFTVDSADGSTLPQFKSGFVTDLEWNRSVTDAAYTAISSRMQGAYYGRTNDTSVPALDNDITWDFMNGWGKATWVQLATRSWMFKRAAGFMDIVCYTGTGSATSFNHNLGVTPLLQIIKRIDSTSSWYVNDYALSPTSRGFLNAGNNFASSGTEWSGSSATTFSVYAGGLANINTSGATYANYLFATVAGVSKVGSYTGNAGYAVNVPCGFSNGARFILIKRTDTTGDWYYWDYFNGISAGNDPYLLLNELNAQVTNTDYIDPLSSGFTVTSSAPAGLNASGGTYIFLAIA